MEPPRWYYSSRTCLGVAMMRATALFGSLGAPQRALEVFQQDLLQYPENGWSLYGAELALRALKRDSDADEYRNRFVAAWQFADVELTSPCPQLE